MTASIPSTGAAQPTVRVRAEARIELRVTRGPGLVTVGGTLRDDLGQPLSDRTVEIRVLSETGQAHGRALAHTDAAGSLSESFALEPGTYRVVARWQGDGGHQHVEVSQTLDLTRAHVRLGVELSAAGGLDLDVREHRVSVRASSDEGGAGLIVEVRNELDRELARGETDSRGSISFTLASEALGPPAAGRLLARTPGDARRAPAQTEVPIVRFRRTRLALEAESTRVREGEAVVLAGQLSDSAGPLPRRAIGLFARDAHLATMLTDDEGRFARSLEVSSEDGAPVALVARYVSDAPWRPAAESPTVEIIVDGGGSTPWPWLLGPMIACALALSWLSRRPRRAAPAARERESLIEPPGIATARATSLAAQQRDVSGIVLDADAGVVLEGVHLRFTRDGAGAVAVATDELGRFRVVLDDGAWLMSAAAEGFQTSEAPLRSPHRGQWCGITVRLRSLRQLALVEYRPVADALAPQRKWWGFWTPRELAGHADPSARADIEELTTAVERAAYAEPHPTETEVGEIGRRSARVARALEEP